MLQEISTLVQQRIAAQVADAVTKYRAANPHLSEQDFAHFERKVTEGIASSAAKDKLMNSKSLRRERRRISKEILANAGFMVKTGSLVETKPINESAPLDVIGSIMLSVMGKQSVRQVITIAAKYEVNGSNTDLLTAFTFLNPADEYDEVIALEHLAERVRGNAVIRVKATERDVFYGIEGRLVGLADTYRKEFLMGAPKAAPVSQNNDQAVTVEV